MRHLNKNEILLSMKEAQNIKKSSEQAPFTGVLIMCNYVLWKDFGYTQDQLIWFNEKFKEMDAVTDDKWIQKMSATLWNFAGFKVEYVPFTEADFPTQKNKLLKDLQMKQIECNNRINKISTRYFLIMFQVLINAGYTKEQLEAVQESINKWMEHATATKGMTLIMQYHRELLNETGIYVEIMDEDGTKRFNENYDLEVI